MEENKKLDDFVRKTVKEVGLEKPSLEFTDSVLSRIQTHSEKSTVFDYQPLLSKRVWLIVGSLISLVFAYLIFGNPKMGDVWFSIARLNRFTQFNLSGIVPDLAVSNTFIYGFIIFTFFMMIQVLIIKQRFDKRYDMS